MKNEGFPVYVLIRVPPLMSNKVHPSKWRFLIWMWLKGEFRKFYTRIINIHSRFRSIFSIN